ncbi:hypothetical protein IGI04_021623 [Brassica rapa subsp. trilocularis]|uniref:Uncharacterized protein n=1 Tax=Brassica rapa subsp. trilocularis TaxID=1813537 RepID=A0ABQ7M1D1_BRACM|nr:hypothetical protein IGI04_021623 [Brassica rapa subsp. trilocularis]
MGLKTNIYITLLRFFAPQILHLPKTPITDPTQCLPKSGFRSSASVILSRLPEFKISAANF